MYVYISLSLRGSQALRGLTINFPDWPASGPPTSVGTQFWRTPGPVQMDDVWSKHKKGSKSTAASNTRDELVAPFKDPIFLWIDLYLLEGFGMTSPRGTFLFISSTLNLECSSFRQMSSRIHLSYWSFQSLARVHNFNFSAKSCLASQCCQNFSAFLSRNQDNVCTEPKKDQ